MRRRVTFSRNVTLSLSRTCRCALQVLRVRDPQAAPARAGGGRAADRPRRAPRRQGAAGPDRRGARPSPRRRASGSPSSASRTSSPTSCGRASGRSSAGCCRTPTSACSSRDGPRAAARGDRLAGADARVGQPRPRRPPGLADQGPGACGWRRSRAARGAEDPVHERDPRRDRRVRGGPDGVARGARRASTTCRRSSSRTSSRTAATTARSRPRSPPTPPSASGAPACTTAPHRDAPKWAYAGRRSRT